MAKKAQYQPTKRSGVDLSAAQQVHYNKDFKQADIAGGYRKQAINRLDQE
ncbi:YfhE family protein [Aquibacillus koreensis]|uniref:YfhE family protein n=1 Tax=Aquibacillus koreensis TaxID=279446 RepID=A0A9X3WNL9_9BACI|nr:YfhE family protein [Aquibacillus koreensis]MCT2534931.1 YfhE family protein [Aquibacillus koreensis]MDC3422175.1 YfhE family protein [Aquibacillus koreensis]